MRKVINFGSMNIDHVYQVDHLVDPGETIEAQSYQVFPGGKGLNQSIALAKAGAQVTHVGKVGRDGLWLKNYLQDRGVDTTLVRDSAEATGHAMIQVSETGENAIVVHGGANRDLDINLLKEAFSQASSGDILLVQNETNAIADIIKQGHQQGLTLAYNPAPMNKEALACPLDKIDWLVVNETEGQALTGKADVNDILNDLKQRFPLTKTVVTLGAKGLMYIDANSRKTVPAFKVDAVDTTGTGDTFIGFFLAALVVEKPLETALSEASAAAALCATRQGAASSIPELVKVQTFLQSG